MEEVTKILPIVSGHAPIDARINSNRPRKPDAPFGEFTEGRDEVAQVAA